MVLRTGLRRRVSNIAKTPLRGGAVQSADRLDHPDAGVDGCFGDAVEFDRRRRHDAVTPRDDGLRVRWTVAKTDFQNCRLPRRNRHCRRSRCGGRRRDHLQSAVACRFPIGDDGLDLQIAFRIVTEALDAADGARGVVFEAERRKILLPWKDQKRPATKGTTIEVLIGGGRVIRRLDEASNTTWCWKPLADHASSRSISSTLRKAPLVECGCSNRIIQKSS